MDSTSDDEDDDSDGSGDGNGDGEYFSEPSVMGGDVENVDQYFNRLFHDNKGGETKRFNTFYPIHF